jgi:hypothetical protein
MITAALRDLASGRVRSIRAAAENYGIAYKTLRDRKRGARVRVKSHEDQQNLTINEEKMIVVTCAHVPVTLYYF